MSIKLEKTVTLIGELFKKAEQETKIDISKVPFCADEEQVTTIWGDYLAKVLLEPTQQKSIENAFKEDIMRGIAEHMTSVQYSAKYYIQTLSHGLVAEVSCHERKIERKTGGDLGLLFIQPKISFYNREISLVRCKSKQGLLVQAKLKKYDKSYGNLTRNQKEILKDRMGYLSLLRYEYTDIENRKLKNFNWTLCNGRTINEVISWLKENKFPENQTSEYIITNLGLGKIGTNDQEIIDSVIVPDRRQTLIIKIDWKDRDPWFDVHNLNKSLQTTVEQYAKQKVIVRTSY